MRRDDYIFHQSADYPSPPVMQQPVGFHPEYPSQNEAIPSYSDYYSYTDYNFYDNNSDTPFTQTGKFYVVYLGKSSLYVNLFIPISL